MVIGSGIGGMAAAALFAKSGYKVCVLEKHEDFIGGHARNLSFSGLTYSMGPQYVWHFEKDGVGDRFLKYLEIDRENPFLEMKKDGFERIFIGDRKNNAPVDFIDFSVPAGFDDFSKNMTARFPECKTGIKRLFQDMKTMFELSMMVDRGYGDSSFITFMSFILSRKYSFFLKLRVIRILFMSLEKFFDSYKISQNARRVLYGHGGIFAENESDLSAIAYILATGNYHKSSHYPKYGFFKLFDSLKQVIEKNGGSVQTGKKAVKLETSGNKVNRVICKDGTVHPCDIVMSNISPRLLAKTLVSVSEKKYSYTPSHSIPACCLGVKRGLGIRQQLAGRNFWWMDGRGEVNYNNPDVTVPPKMLYIASSTANGFGNLAETDEADSLVVFCPGNYKQEKAIHDKGSEVLKEFKSKLSEEIVEIIDRNVIPGVKKNFLFSHILTSIDIERDTAAELGNAYGRRVSVKEMLKGFLKLPGEGYTNLYHVSATANGAGVANGISAAVGLLKKLADISV